MAGIFEGYILCKLPTIKYSQANETHPSKIHTTLIVHLEPERDFLHVHDFSWI